MARIVREEDYNAKRNEILGAALDLIYTKGYEHMTIQDILDRLQISKGAFYHYFDSREALLAGFIERVKQDSAKPLLPIIHDPDLSAIEKLQGFFDALDRERMARKADVVSMARVWYADSNALVRDRLNDAIRRQRAPLLAEVVRQGIREGVFTAPYPDQAGEILLYLLQGMGDSLMQVLLSCNQAGDGAGAGEARCIEEILTIDAACLDAMERVLGAPPMSLRRAGRPQVEAWLAVFQGREAARDSSREMDR